MLQAMPEASKFPAEYTPLQIALHWIVAGLVLVQWATYDAIHRTHDPLRAPSTDDLREHAFHTYSGIAIGLLMLLRLWVRLRHGAPPPPAGEPRWRALTASVVHHGFYAALLAQAATGFTAAYVWGGAGVLHGLIWNVILALLALHLAGIVFHAVRRDDVVWRMTALWRD